LASSIIARCSSALERPRPFDRHDGGEIAGGGGPEREFGVHGAKFGLRLFPGKTPLRGSA
jgi:hypothetical protein